MNASQGRARPGRRPRASISVRTLRETDFEGVAHLERQHYPDEQPSPPEQLRSRMRAFPEGQLVAVDDATGRIVGYAASLIIRWDDYEFNHNWDQFTSRGWFTNHDPVHGRTLYGAEILVDPHMQGRGIGKTIYRARFDLCRRLGLARIRAGARLVGYHRYADRMSAEDYVIAVVNRELGDPTLSFQLKRGFRVIAVVADYLPRDPKSLGYAAVIEWINHAVARPSDYRRRDPRFARRRKRPHS